MNALDDTARHFREQRRKALWIGFVWGAAAMLLLTTCVGCAAPTLLTEIEHVSHPLTGWPAGPRHRDEFVLSQVAGPQQAFAVSLRRVGLEDSVTQANVMLHWEGSGWYADAGVGYNLLGRDGGGFYGPSFTGTVRVGKEWRLFR